MSGSLTQFGEQLLLYYSVGLADQPDDNVPSKNAGLYVGLSLNDIINETSDAVDFSEASWPIFTALAPSGYQRQRLNPQNWVLDLTGDQTKLTYNAQVTFPTFTGIANSTVMYLVLYSKATGGKPIWYSKISTNGRVLSFGDTLSIPANSISLYLT